MQSIELTIQAATSKAMAELFNADLSADQITINDTRKEFDGDITVVIFPLLRYTKKKPEESGELIGAYLKENVAEVDRFNVVKGFLNLGLSKDYWNNVIQEIYKDEKFAMQSASGQKVMVEYSSPNTNKPLHLGHLRNNVLGYAVSGLLEANGHEVMKVNLINDRGIHICKSMLAYEILGQNETPKSSKMKGDHFVGKYYVLYNKLLKREMQRLYLMAYKQFEEIKKDRKIGKNEIISFSKSDKILMIKQAYETAWGNYLYWRKEINYNKLIGYTVSTEKLLSESKSELRNKSDFDKARKNFAKLISGKEIEFKSNNVRHIFKQIKREIENILPLQIKAQEMLQKWEAGDEETVALWTKMNQWVYDGFEVTYNTLGVTFDKFYYESETYLLGKQVIEEGLKSGVFFKKEDGSVWVDLTDDGLDEKLLLRADGTSVYITQDIGTADKKYADFKMDRSLYVVGNEQDYHFKVLQLICKKLGRPHADGIYHFSYGMVDLPHGKMKSREGTVVDADDLMAEMIATVKKRTSELGKIDEFSEEEAEELFRTIALGALKFFLLRIEPRKGMLFNPEESIDFQGYTGTFTQFNYTRIQSIVRKFETSNSLPEILPTVEWNELESELIQTLSRFPRTIIDAGEQLNPAALVDYAYNLAKSFSKYYAEVSILGAENQDVKIFRVMLASIVGRTIKQAFKIVGINVPERM